MTNRCAAVALGMTVALAAAADDKKVHFVGDFESGRIATNGSLHDGFYIATLPDPQSGAEVLHASDSDFGPTAAADTRVVRSELVGGEVVKPRKGEYFLRSEVSRDKNYLDLNNYAKNRPRSKIYMSNEKHLVDFDEEGFVGFSLFAPVNFEHELGVRDHRGDSMLFVLNSDSSRTLMNLGVWVQKPNTEAHWYVRTWTNDGSVQEDGATVDTFDLGPIGADLGKWTDFVIRYRFNPFDVATNPRDQSIGDSMDRLFEGNKGILQVWKAEGSADGNGNRKMVLKIDRVNKPIGLVPHATAKIGHKWRIYKYGWLSNPTTLTRPVWFGFDEIRQGLVGRDGTSFADVAPSGAPCESGCGAVSVVKPTPPSSVKVE